MGITAESAASSEEANETLTQGFASYFEAEEEQRETENKFQKALKKFFGIDVSDGMEGTSGANGGSGFLGKLANFFGLSGSSSSGSGSSSSGSSFGSGTGGGSSSSSGAYSSSGGGNTSTGTAYSSSTGGRSTTGSGTAPSTGSTSISGGEDNEQKIWNFLKSQGFSDEAAAGIMGSFQVESGFDTGSIEGNYLNPSGAKEAITSLDNMDAWVQNVLFPAYERSGINVNKEAYKIDGEHYAPALGLAQWTGGRTQALMDYGGNNWNDLDTQLNFMMSEFGGSYSGVYDALQNVSSAEEAAKIFRNKYEGSTYKESEAKQNAANLLKKYAGSYNGGLVNTSEGQGQATGLGANASSDWIANALSFEGYKEGSNNDTIFGDWIGSPNQPWCAAFVSYNLAQAGISGLKSAAVSGLRDQAMQMGIYHDKNDGYTPQYGDVFINKGGKASHTGFVLGSDGDSFQTIEGNASDMVKSLTRHISDGAVSGFISLGNGGSYNGGVTASSEDANSLSTYDQGTPWVPNDQIAYLHQGEMVVPAEFNPLNNNGMEGDVSSVANYEGNNMNSDNSDIVDAITWAVTTLGAKLDALASSGGIPKKGIAKSNSGIIYSL